MRHRKRKVIVDTPTVDLDRLPHGGHDFEQMEDHEDDSDFTYVCTLCHCVVSGWELDEGLWPGRVGRYCMAVLMGGK